MTIIIDSKIPYKSIYEYETTVEINLDKIHSFDGDAGIEDKVLAVYKMYVDNKADLVVLTDIEVVNALQLEGVHVCYAKQGEIDG